MKQKRVTRDVTNECQFLVRTARSCGLVLVESSRTLRSRRVWLDPAILRPFPFPLPVTRSTHHTTLTLAQLLSSLYSLYIPL